MITIILLGSMLLFIIFFSAKVFSIIKEMNSDKES